MLIFKLLILVTLITVNLTFSWCRLIETNDSQIISSDLRANLSDPHEVTAAAPLSTTIMSIVPLTNNNNDSLTVTTVTPGQPQMMANCGSKFLCPSTGHCVFYSWVCDNVSDCIGGEDEANCVTNVCPPGYHRCNQTGQCVPYKWICEGSFVCPGHTGPLPCTNYTCPPGKFKCSSGLCIPNYLICDGDPDCSGGDDETETMCALYCSSSTGKYLCSGGRKCISTMSQCDLINDCPQMDDELNCSMD